MPSRKAAHSWPRPGTYKDGKNLTVPKKGAKRKAGKAAAVGSDKAHQRLLEQEARLYQLMTEHEANGEDVLAAETRTEWTKLATAIGTSEMREIRNQVKRGELVSRTGIEQEFTALVHHMPEVIRTELKGLRSLCDPEPPAKTWEAQIDKLLDALFATLPETLTFAVGAKIKE